MRMPNFSCANIEGANFDYHALFPGVMTVWWTPKGITDKPGRDTARPAVARPPKFLKANIKDAHFEKVRFFTFSQSTPPSKYMKLTTSTIAGELFFQQGDMADIAFQIEAESTSHGSPKSRENDARGEAKDVDRDLLAFQQRIRAAFYQVELEHAFLPENVANFLKSSIPTFGDFETVFRTPRSSALDPDLQCTPRHN